jgi:hypothetical protein
MTKQIPKLSIPGIRLAWHKTQLARLEGKLRSTVSGADNQDAISRVFIGDYQKLLDSMQNRDKTEILPIEISAFVGCALSRDLNYARPDDYFFGNPTKEGTYQVNAFLKDLSDLNWSQWIKNPLIQRIASITTYPLDNQRTKDSTISIVSVEKNHRKLLLKTIEGTLDRLHQDTKLHYAIHYR